MFTGIVREEGEVLRAETTPQGSTLTIGTRLIRPEMKIGDSISVNGCCLTVVALGEQSFQVEATPETLRLTNLGGCGRGARVNLEPAARISDFLGGHLVQGHVDDKGRVLSIVEEGNSSVFRFSASEKVLRYCAYKGSITVNGVSLTITASGPDYFEVAIIPHTLEVTNFSSLKPGSEVNLEADIISKYVESHVKRLMASVSLVFLLCLGQLAAADLELGPGTVLIFENSSPAQTNQFVVRLARLGPDLVAEWESERDQGTVHIFRKAVSDARRFTLTSLFEVGVDSEASDQTTIILSDWLYGQLTSRGDTKFHLNNLPSKWKLLGEGTSPLIVDDEEIQIQTIELEDSRGGKWTVLHGGPAPFVVRYETTYFTQVLKKVITSRPDSLRWIKKLPPVR